MIDPRTAYNAIEKIAKRDIELARDLYLLLDDEIIQGRLQELAEQANLSGGLTLAKRSAESEAFPFS